MKFQFLFCVFFYACIQTMHFHAFPCISSEPHHPKNPPAFQKSQAGKPPPPLSQGLKPSPLAVRAWLKGGLMAIFWGGRAFQKCFLEADGCLFTGNPTCFARNFAYRNKIMIRINN